MGFKDGWLFIFHKIDRKPKGCVSGIQIFVETFCIKFFLKMFLL